LVVIALSSGKIMRKFPDDDFAVQVMKVGNYSVAPNYYFDRVPNGESKDGRIRLVGASANANCDVYSEKTGVLYESCYDGNLLAWRLPSPSPIFRSRISRQVADALAASPDGNFLAYGTHISYPPNDPKRMGNKLMIIDAHTGKLICKVKAQTDGVNWLDFSPDGKLLAEADNGRFVRIFQIDVRR
jgi:WD40 repeat protein